MLKKIIIALIIIGSIALSTFSFSENKLNNEFECKVKKSNFTAEEFIGFLKSKNIDLYNSFNQKANHILYNYFNEVVYLNSDDITSVFNETVNRTKEEGLLGDYLTADGNWEWEWIGYTLNGEKFYNKDFPPDYTDTNFKTYNYTPVSGAQESWEEVNHYEGLKDYIMSADLYHKKQRLDFQLDDHIIENINTNVLVQSIPGLFTDGSLKVEKDWGDYYATFAIKGFGGDSRIQSNLTVDQQTFKVREGESIDLSITLNNKIILEEQARLNHLKSISNKLYKDGEILETQTTNSIDQTNHTLTYQIQLESAQLDYGVNYINFSSETQLETIFGQIDALESFGNTYAEDELTIKVIKYRSEPLQAILIMESDSYNIDSRLPKDITITLDGRQSIAGNDGIETIEFYLDDQLITTKSNINESLATEALTLTVNRTITQKDQQVKGTIKIYDEETNCNASDEQTITITKDEDLINHEPSVNIYAEDYVALNQSTTINVMANDIDGDTIVMRDSEPLLTLGSNDISFDTLGIHELSVVVEDDHGLTATDQNSIEVVKPQPHAFFKKIGQTKENHTVCFDASDSNNQFENYPIDWSKTKWEIQPIESINEENIYFETEEDHQSIQATFNTTGIIEVHLTLYNTLGFKSHYSNRYAVAPDLPPNGQMTLKQSYIRNPLNANNASIIIFDQSESLDGDQLTKRIYKITYDEDNNGVFDEKGYVYISDVGFVNEDLVDGNKYVTLNSGNKEKVVFKTDKIGSYQVELIVLEAHDNRLLNFIEPSKILSDRAVETTQVINVAPVSSLALTMEEKETINLYVLTDYAGEELLELSHQLNQLKIELDQIGKSLRIQVINDSQKIGAQTVHVTENEYARFIDYVYRENGYDYLWTTADGLVTNEMVDHLVEGEIIYETILSDTLPKNEDFSKGKTIASSISDQEITETTETSQRVEKFYSTSFYDPDNKINTLVDQNFIYYQELLTPTQTAFHDYDQNILLDSLDFDFTRANFWTATGETIESTEENDVMGVDYTALLTENYNENERNILLMLGNGQSFDTTSPLKNYFFGSLQSDLKELIINQNFETYAAVPDDIYDFKYDHKQYNTSINDQAFSIKDLINSSPVRGKKLNVETWVESLGFLKNTTDQKIEAVETVNNEIQITLNPMDCQADYRLNYYKEQLDIIANNNTIIDTFEVANLVQRNTPIEPITNGFYLEDLPPSKVYYALDEFYLLANHLIVKPNGQSYQVYGNFQENDIKDELLADLKQRTIKSAEYIYDGEYLKIVYDDHSCHLYQLQPSNFNRVMTFDNIQQVKYLPNDYDRFSIFNRLIDGTVKLNYYLYDDPPMNRETIESEFNALIGQNGPIQFIESIKNDYLLALYDNGKIKIEEYYNNDLSEDDQLTMTDAYDDAIYETMYILEDFVIGKTFNNTLAIVAYKNKYNNSALKSQLEEDLTTPVLKIWDTFGNALIVTNDADEIAIIGINTIHEGLTAFLDTYSPKDIRSNQSSVMVLDQKNKLHFLKDDNLQSTVTSDQALFDIKNVNDQNRIFFDENQQYFYKIFQKHYTPTSGEKAVGFQPVSNGDIIDVKADEYVGLAQLNEALEIVQFSIRKGIHHDK